LGISNHADDWRGRMKAITHTFWLLVALATLIFLGLIVALPGGI
jgi:hypothetical protein